MANILAKAALALGLVLAAVPAIARERNDFIPQEPSSKQPGGWEWAWDGRDGLGVGIAATVRYVPTGPARIVITGPEESLQQLEVGQGQIRWCDTCRGSRKLEVVVSGVRLRSVSVHGAGGDIQLGRLDQDRLNLSISGTGRASAEGRIDRVDLSISGSGDADLGRAAVQRANIHISGSGNAAITPREEANVHVSGSGNVRMTASPPRLRQAVSGSGGVRIANSGNN
jgi:hypothetical protein